MSEVTRACKTCQVQLGRFTRTGYCQEHARTALPCVIEGCSGRVAAWAKRGYCKRHKAIADAASRVSKDVTCRSCKGPVTKLNRTGYCSTCIDSVRRCIAEGCGQPVAAWSKRSVCSRHIAWGRKLAPTPTGPRPRPSRWDGWL